MMVALAQAELTEDAVGHAAHRIGASSDVDVRDLTKRFGGVEVLKGASFHVPAGDTVALIGSNGAGKSTLLRCCMRLIEPDAGSVRLLGQDMAAMRRGPLRRLRSRIGFVFQKHNLVPRLSALSNVLHGAIARTGTPRVWHHAIAPQGYREEAMACLEQVGLGDLADRRADQLSGGQSQRVAIARTLMQRPALVMADEPAASLDPVAAEEVMRLLSDLMKRQGLTLLFTSHNLDHALAYADRVIGLRAGTIALDGTTAGEDRSRLEAIYG